jgi:hypothetical protein
MIHAEQKCVKKYGVAGSPFLQKLESGSEDYKYMAPYYGGREDRDVTWGICTEQHLGAALTTHLSSQSMRYSYVSKYAGSTVIFTENTDSSIDLATSDGVQKKPRNLGGRTLQRKYYK